MGSLPALMIRPPEIKGVLDQYGEGVQLKSLLQRNQIQDMQIQEAKQQQADEQAAHQIIGAHNGDLISALPELSTKVSPKTYIGLQKTAIELKKSYGEMKKTDLENDVMTSDKMLGLISQGKQLPPEQYQQAWPDIYQQAVALNPKLQGKLDPAKPVPQQALDSLGLGILVHSQIAKQELDQRQAEEAKQKAAESAAKLPGEVAKSKIAEQDLALGAEGRAGNKRAQTEASMAYEAAGGDPKKALAILDKSKLNSRPIINNMTGNDVKDIAGAIMNGDQPPTLTGLYRNAGPVRAELARNGFPLAQAEGDWKATQKHLATLNGAQQERLRQAITFTSDSTNIIDKLYDEWKQVGSASGIKLFNKASLATAKQLPGKAGEVATALEAQINDLTSELGTVYKGGNSSTDESLKLASSNLSADWNEQTFKRALGLIRTNLQLRANSIKHSSIAGASESNPYAPKQAPDTSTSTTKTLSMSAIQKAAKDHGVSVDEAKKQAQAAGYTVQ